MLRLGDSVWEWETLLFWFCHCSVFGCLVFGRSLYQLRICLLEELNLFVEWCEVSSNWKCWWRLSMNLLFLRIRSFLRIYLRRCCHRRRHRHRYFLPFSISFSTFSSFWMTSCVCDSFSLIPGKKLIPNSQAGSKDHQFNCPKNLIENIWYLFWYLFQIQFKFDLHKTYFACQLLALKNRVMAQMVEIRQKLNNCLVSKQWISDMWMKFELKVQFWDTKGVWKPNSLMFWFQTSLDFKSTDFIHLQ